jgi:Zn-dependent protease with chaperone function
MTGLFGTRRIVLWDTLLAKLSREEVLVVMSHEIGHYVLGHSWYKLILQSVLTLCAFYLAYRIMDGVTSRFSERFGFDRIQELASLPLLLLVFAMFRLTISPVTLAFSRHLEHEADRFALELTQDNHAAATAIVALMSTNLGVPSRGPIERFFRSTHPSLSERIDFANSYRPWERGESLRYEDLFRRVD